MLMILISNQFSGIHFLTDDVALLHCQFQTFSISYCNTLESFCTILEVELTLIGLVEFLERYFIEGVML